MITSLKNRLIGGSLWAFIGIIFATLSNLFINVVLTRSTTPENVGIYFLLISIITFLATIGCLGYDYAIVKIISEEIAFKRFTNIRPIFLHILYIISFSAIFLIFIFLIGANLFNLNYLHENKIDSILFLLFLCTLLAIFQRFISEFFRGLHDLRGLILYSGIGSQKGIGILVGFLFPITLWFFSYQDFIDLFDIFLFLVVINFFVIIIALLDLNLKIKKFESFKKNKLYPANSRIKKRAFQIAIPLLIASLLVTFRLQIDIWLIGAITTPDQVALYASAMRLALLVTAPLLMIKTVLPPIISELYVKQEIFNLERLLRVSTSIVGIPSVIIFLILIIYGKNILIFFYGSFYGTASNFLTVLCVGQIINVASGSCGIVLAMTEHQKINMYTNFFATIITLVFGFYSIKFFGAIGMAYASITALTVQNLIMIYAVKKRIGIWTLFSIKIRDIAILKDFLVK